MSKVKRFVNLVRRNTTHSHFEEIHVEAIVNDIVYANLLCYAPRHPDTMFMLTGPSELWIKKRCQAEFLTDAEYSKILAERYQTLASVTDSLGLHVHLFHPKSIKIPTFGEQFEKIKDSKEFLDRLDLPTYDFAPGWWGFNEDTVVACSALGIERFHCAEIPAFYDLVDVEFVRIWRACDDFQLKAKRL